MLCGFQFADGHCHGSGQQRAFKVHKQLLVLNSPYFEKALNGPFSEASKQEVVIDDVSDTVFAATSTSSTAPSFVPPSACAPQRSAARCP